MEQDTRAFRDWLWKELKKRNLTQSKLVEKSEEDISAAAISHVLNGTRKPGLELCRAVASALNYPTEYVLRKAGLLEATEEEIDPRLVEANRLMKELPEEYRGQALALVRFLHDNHVKFKTTEANSSAK